MILDRLAKALGIVHAFADPQIIMTFLTRGLRLQGRSADVKLDTMPPRRLTSAYTRGPADRANAAVVAAESLRRRAPRPWPTLAGATIAAGSPSGRW